MKWPAPVLTMMAWTASSVIMVLAIMGRYGSASPDHRGMWFIDLAVAGILLLVLVVWGVKTPVWFLRLVVAVKIVGVNSLWWEVHVPEIAVAVTLNLLVAVVYAGYWWPGRWAFTYAGLASVSLLVTALVFEPAGSYEITAMAMTLVSFGTAWGLTAADRRATHDDLTGLLNRVGLAQYLSMHTRVGRAMLPRVIVVIDLDCLKVVNDTKGHAAGDQVLSSVARSWRSLLRPDDFAARIGGDEFVLILPQTDVTGAAQLIRRLRRAHPFPWSCGLTEWHPGEYYDRAFARADALMYQDKTECGGTKGLDRPVLGLVADAG